MKGAAFSIIFNFKDAFMKGIYWERNSEITGTD